jgi:Rps23 Pro-64 3,4-dihydroxylase Tpa1-like proline 4-hydroxylase
VAPLSSPGFSLHPQLNPGELASEFRRCGRVQLSPFLAEADAKLLLDHLRSRTDWRLVLNAGDRVFEIDRPGQAALNQEQRQAMEALVNAEARDGFQYRFESVRVPDDERQRAASATLLDAFATFMSSEEVLRLLRLVTGKPAISFADAQGTCYSPGHFLNRHDDDVEGKQRQAAYVLGLTESWNADWGGLLLFHDWKNSGVALMPEFNVLNIFAVPQPHSVTFVAPFAAHARYSITGWLRTKSSG